MVGGDFINVPLHRSPYRVFTDRAVRNYFQHHSADHVFHGLAHGGSPGTAVENYERPYEDSR